MTARYLLDTDWVIDHFDGIVAITRRLEQLWPLGLASTVVWLAELYEGVHYSRDSAAGRRILPRFVHGLTVVPVDDEICDIFGRERERLQQLHRAVGDFDLVIAARDYGTTSLLYAQPPSLRDDRRIRLVGIAQAFVRQTPEARHFWRDFSLLTSPLLAPLRLFAEAFVDNGRKWCQLWRLRQPSASRAVISMSHGGEPARELGPPRCQ